MNPAYAYLRVSGESQIDGGGLDRQIDVIRAYAASHGIEIIRVFREEGVSGTRESGDRPAWIEMIAAIMANGVKTVLIEKLCRLSRDVMVQEHIIKDLQQRRIRLISATPGEANLLEDDPGDPTRKLLRVIVGAIVEYEKSMLVAKLKAGRKRKKALGEHVDGPLPYGSEPSEEPILAKMIEMRRAGFTLCAITKHLMETDVPTRRGKKPWQPRVVARILARSGNR